MKQVFEAVIRLYFCFIFQMDTFLCEWLEWFIWANKDGIMEDMGQMIIAPLMVEGLVFTP